LDNQEESELAADKICAQKKGYRKASNGNHLTLLVTVACYQDYHHT